MKGTLSGGEIIAGVFTSVYRMSGGLAGLHSPNVCTSRK